MKILHDPPCFFPIRQHPVLLVYQSTGTPFEDRGRFAVFGSLLPTSSSLGEVGVDHQQISLSSGTLGTLPFRLSSQYPPASFLHKLRALSCADLEVKFAESVDVE